MSCPVCKGLICTCSSKLQGIFGGFSLVGGDYPGGTLLTNQESSFIVDCPPGVICQEGLYPIIIKIPAGTVTVPYTGGGPEGFPVLLRLPCGTGEITRTLPQGSTEAEILAAYAEMMLECGQTVADGTAQTVYGTGITYTGNYGNDPISVSCPEGQTMQVTDNWTGNPGISFNQDTGNLDVAEGLFTVEGTAFTAAAAKAQANAMAQAYGETALENLIEDGALECGYFNTEQSYDCGGGDIKTVAAGVFWSTVSQADANQQAQDFLQESCITVCADAFNSLTWSLSSSCGAGYSGSGSGASATLQTGPGVIWTCPRLLSSSVYIPGTLDCDVTVSLHAESDSARTASASFYVRGSLAQHVANDTFSGPVHINGTNKSWYFELRVGGAGTWPPPTISYAKATVFLGS